MRSKFLIHYSIADIYLMLEQRRDEEQQKAESITSSRQQSQRREIIKDRCGDGRDDRR